MSNHVYWRMLFVGLEMFTFDIFIRVQQERSWYKSETFCHETVFKKKWSLVVEQKLACLCIVNHQLKSLHQSATHWNLHPIHLFPFRGLPSIEELASSVLVNGHPSCSIPPRNLPSFSLILLHGKSRSLSTWSQKNRIDVSLLQKLRSSPVNRIPLQPPPPPEVRSATTRDIGLATLSEPPIPIWTSAQLYLHKASSRARTFLSSSKFITTLNFDK